MGEEGVEGGVGGDVAMVPTIAPVIDVERIGVISCVGHKMGLSGVGDNLGRIGNEGVGQANIEVAALLRGVVASQSWVAIRDVALSHIGGVWPIVAQWHAADDGAWLGEPEIFHHCVVEVLPGIKGNQAYLGDGVTIEFARREGEEYAETQRTLLQHLGCLVAPRIGEIALIVEQSGHSSSERRSYGIRIHAEAAVGMIRVEGCY